MISKIKKILAGMLLVVALGLPIGLPVLAHAADTSALCTVQPGM